MRTGPTLAALLTLLVLVPAGAAEGDVPPDFVVHIAADAPPLVESTPGLASLGPWSAHGRVTLNLHVTTEYAVGEVRADGWFNVARAKQVVPVLSCDGCSLVAMNRSLGDADDYLFWEIHRPDPRDVDAPGLYANASGGARTQTLALGVPGPGDFTLVLEADVTPPEFTVGPVTNVTAISFLQTSATTERAIGNLQRVPSRGGEIVENPTPAFAFYQTYSIQGLDADEEYECRIVFTDWSGNAAATPSYRVRTVARSPRPVPRVAPIEPAPNATLAAPVVVVSASVDSPDSPVGPDGVRVFVDLADVTERSTFRDGVVEYAPTVALGPGFHRVSVEATNAAGGRGDARWAFMVASPGAPAPSPAPGPAAAVAAAVAIVVARLWPTRRP